MAFYLMQDGGDDETTKFSICGFPSTHPHFFYPKWFDGKPVDRELQNPLDFSLNKNHPIFDWVFCSSLKFLISDKFFNCIKDINWKYEDFPATIRFKDKFISKNHHCINILSIAHCLAEGSQFDPLGRFLSFDESRLPQYDLSVLEGMPFFVASERLKTIVEENNISGVKFIKVKYGKPSPKP